jgi:D-3-phosphoglycerate dehydrogenase / 2-oxoglutarate reductase
MSKVQHKRLKLIIAEPKDFSEEVKVYLKASFDLTIKNLKSDELEYAFCNHDIFWFRLGFKIDRNLIEMSNRTVKYIVTPVTGLNHIDTIACAEYGINIISLKGEFEFLKEVRATAEHTLLLTLALLRKLVPAVESTISGSWDRELYKGNEIFKKTVGIIGFGRLGKIVYDYYKALGAYVMIYEKYPNAQLRDSSELVDMNTLLRESDIVSLHINFLPENIEFFTARHFSLMKPSAVFINTSRGQLVNGEALKDALINSEISGAALDVISDEFDLSNSPELDLLTSNKLANLLITPHIGGNTWESFDKTEKFIYNKLIKAIN